MTSNENFNLNKKSEQGLSLLKEVVRETIKANPGKNKTEIARIAGLESHKNYLVWGIINLLEKDGIVIRKEGNSIYIDE